MNILPVVNRFILSCALLVLPACAINYDPTTDQQVTSATQDGDQQLATWESSLTAKTPISYDPKAYGKIIGDLNTLKTRLSISSDPQTRSLTKIVDNQITLWEQIEANELKYGFNATYLKLKGDLFNYNMGLLTQYESALKGSSGTSASNAAATATSSGTGTQ